MHPAVPLLTLIDQLCSCSGMLIKGPCTKSMPCVLDNPILLQPSVLRS